MSPPLPYQPDILLSACLDIIREASALVLEIRQRGFETKIKPDFSPVTEADKASELCILRHLRQKFPAIAAIGEEENAEGITVDHGDSYWLVDPLDGTRSFAAGGDDFAINIGLVTQGVPVLGVVALPAYGQFYTGGKFLPAQRHQAAGTDSIQVKMPEPEGLRVLTSCYNHSDIFAEQWLKGRKIRSVQALGSSLKMMRIAEGEADFYPRCGPTMEWDTAAPQAILEAAGGHLLDETGHVLRYGKKDWRNPPFFCFGPESERES